MTKIEMMLEAEKRGILPPEKKAILDEARRRGLVQGGPQVSEKRRSPQELQAAMAAGDEQARQEWDERNSAIGGNEAYSPVSDSNYENFMAGFGKSAMDTGHGIQQLFGGRTQAEVDEQRRLDAPLMDSGAGIAGTVAGTVSQLAIPVGGFARGASYMGRAAPFVASGVKSGVLSGLQPVGSGETRAGNAAEGAAYGVAGQGLATGMGVIASKSKPVISKSLQASINTAKKYGIPLNVSQVSDSVPLKTMASALNKLPFSGNPAKAQEKAFTRAVSNTIGENADEITDDVIKSAANRTGAGYDKLFSANSIKLDSKLMRDFKAIKEEAKNLPEEGQRVISKQMEDIIAKVNAGGSVPGKAYQAFRVDRLKKLEAGSANDPFKQSLIKQVRKSLEGAAERSMSGQDSKALAALNQQFGNRKIIEQALKQVGGAGGSVKPASLWPLVNRKGSTKEMRELARMGQVVLKDPIPDSGTAQRTLMYGLLGGGSLTGTLPLLAKASAAGAIGGRLLNSNLASRTLPGAGHKTISGLARLAKAAPVALPAVMGARGQDYNRSKEIMAAAFEQPERGPEILSNLPDQEQEQAALMFAQQNGLDVQEVLQRVQAERQRVSALFGRR